MNKEAMWVVGRSVAVVISLYVIYSIALSIVAKNSRGCIQIIAEERPSTDGRYMAESMVQRCDGDDAVEALVWIKKSEDSVLELILKEKLSVNANEDIETVSRAALPKMKWIDSTSLEIITHDKMNIISRRQSFEQVVVKYKESNLM